MLKKKRKKTIGGLEVGGGLGGCESEGEPFPSDSHMINVQRSAESSHLIVWLNKCETCRAERGTAAVKGRGGAMEWKSAELTPRVLCLFHGF